MQMFVTLHNYKFKKDLSRTKPQG